MMAARSGLALLLVSALGCAERAASPAGSLGQYGTALEREDWTAAYSLMSASYRKRPAVPRTRASGRSCQCRLPLGE